MDTYTIPNQNITPHHRGSYIVGQYTDTRLNIA